MLSFHTEPFDIGKMQDKKGNETRKVEGLYV
jgi:hypothetical protein